MPMRISSKVSGLAIGLAKGVSSFILSAPDPSRAGEGLGWYLRLFGGESGRGVFLGLNALEFDRQAERAHFLDEDVEALGDSRLERVVALDDRLVDLGAPDHIVRLDRQHLL